MKTDMFFRRIYTNTLKLFLGNGFNASLGLLTSIMCARALGSESFGILVFMFAYEGVMGQFFSFNAWTAVVAFGNKASEADADSSIFKILKVAFILDFSGAIIGAFAAFFLSSYVSLFMKWDASVAEMLGFYCLAILFKSSGAPIGYLRLRQRFSDLAVVTVVHALVRFFLVAAAFLLELALKDFIKIYVLAALIQYLVVFSAFLRRFGLQKLKCCLMEPVSGFNSKFKGFWSYVLTSNLHSTVKLFTREADQLIVSIYVPISSLGLLKIARQSARVLPLAAEAAYQTIFSSLSQLWASGKRKEFFSLIRHSSIMGICTGVIVWLVFLFCGRFFLDMTFGSAFISAYQPTLIYLAAMVLAVAGLPFQPAMLAMGRPGLSFKINLVATVVYLIFLVALSAKFSINGAAFAYVVYYSIWISAMKVYFSNLVRNNEKS